MCSRDSDCTKFNKDGKVFQCSKRFIDNRGRCAPKELVDWVGGDCNIYPQAQRPCKLGLQCSMDAKGINDVPGSGYCAYPFDEGNTDIPYAICADSREVFNYNTLNTYLKESDVHTIDITQTKCMKKSRFNQSQIGTQGMCEPGQMQIAYERTNCAQGSRRAYCAPTDKKNKPGGYKWFPASQAQIFNESEIEKNLRERRDNL